MIQPGLERIGLLLKNVEFPWRAVHVAGTNGKGSVCAYTHALLTRRGQRCGRFTSPHLVDRWDCIYINELPVDEAKFKKVERHFIALNKKENIQASEFELLTATAFQLFTDYQVNVGVVEVGLGGKLDATNILQNQAVSVITKIAHDHQAFLGNTLEEIARHKAGILRPNVPYVVDPSNEWHVKEVIDEVAKEIGAGPRLSVDSELKRELNSPERLRDWNTIASKFERFQQDNLLLAYLAVKEYFRTLDRATEIISSMYTMRNVQMPGRLQSVPVPGVFGTPDRRILIDGAHNPDSARALNAYVKRAVRRDTTLHRYALTQPKAGWPVTWVIAMSQGKDPQTVLRELLQDGDRVIFTSFSVVDGMPWVKPVDPNELKQIVEKEMPGCHVVTIPEGGAYQALMAAKCVAPDGPIVLAGSLYLVGDFFREQRVYEDPEEASQLQEIERKGKERFLASHNYDGSSSSAQSRTTAAKDETIKDGGEDAEPAAPVNISSRQKFVNELEEIRKRIDKIPAATASDANAGAPEPESSSPPQNPQSPKFKIRKHPAR